MIILSLQQKQIVTQTDFKLCLKNIQELMLGVFPIQEHVREKFYAYTFSDTFP